MPVVFTGLQAPSLKVKSARVVTTLIVHQSLICLMLRCFEFEFSNDSSQPLQVNLKFCCNEMKLLAVVVRGKKAQTIKQNKHTAGKKETQTSNQKSNQTKNQ